MASLVLRMPPRLHADLHAGLRAEVPHGLQHEQGVGGGGVDRDLAGRGLDEVRAGHHAEPGGAADVVVRGQLAGLEDHLEAGAVAALRLDRGDLLVDLQVVAGEERAAVDDHVDLVGARGDGVRRVGQLHGERGAPGREGGGDRGDLDAGARDGGLGGGHHVGVDADGGGRRGRTVGRIGVDGLGGERPDLARGVRAFERRQVDHGNGQVDGVGLRRGLDRAGAEGRGARLQADGIDAGQPVEEAAQRTVGRGHVGECGSCGCSGGHGHQSSISTRVATCTGELCHRARGHRGSCGVVTPVTRP